MKKNLGIKSAFLVASMLMTLAAAPTFAADDMMAAHHMEVMNKNGVTFMSGGVGLDERKEMESTAKDYNVYVTNADGHGLLTADTTITIHGKKGGELISVSNTGPLFYAKLPPGTYTMTAENGGQHLKRMFTISGNKRKNISLIWKGTSVMSAENGR